MKTKKLLSLVVSVALVMGLVGVFSAGVNTASSPGGGYTASPVWEVLGSDTFTIQPDGTAVTNPQKGLSTFNGATMSSLSTTLRVSGNTNANTGGLNICSEHHAGNAGWSPGLRFLLENYKSYRLVLTASLNVSGNVGFGGGGWRDLDITPSGRQDKAISTTSTTVEWDFTVNQGFEAGVRERLVLSLPSNDHTLDIYRIAVYELCDDCGEVDCICSSGGSGVVAPIFAAQGFTVSSFQHSGLTFSNHSAEIAGYTNTLAVPTATDGWRNGIRMSAATLGVTAPGEYKVQIIYYIPAAALPSGNPADQMVWGLNDNNHSSVTGASLSGSQYPGFTAGQWTTSEITIDVTDVAGLSSSLRFGINLHNKDPMESGQAWYVRSVIVTPPSGGGNGGENGGDTGTGTKIWELEITQGLVDALNANTASGGVRPAMNTIGQPTFALAGGNLAVSNRTSGWQSLDVLLAPLNLEAGKNYRITVVGSSTEAFLIHYPLEDGPPWDTDQTNGTTTGVTKTFTSVIPVDDGKTQTDGHRLRVRTSGTANFTIESIVIEELGGTGNGGDNGNGNGGNGDNGNGNGENGNGNNETGPSGATGGNNAAGSGSGGGGGGNRPGTGTTPSGTGQTQTQSGLTGGLIVDIPMSVINETAGNLPVIQVSAVSAGAVNVPAGANAAGHNAVLLFFNPATGKFEVVDSTKIDASGNGVVNVPRAGDYIIVIAQTGDISGSAGITAQDALLLLSALSGESELNPLQEFLGDTDGDGKITATDALNILKIVTGVITSF